MLDREKKIEMLQHCMGLPGITPREMHLLRTMVHLYSSSREDDIDQSTHAEIAALLQKCKDLTLVQPS